MSAAEAERAGAPAAAVGRYRWVIVALLFTAMVINYVDRQTIGLLKADLTKEFGWTETAYADLVLWFQAAYAIAYLLWGRIMDQAGARYGFGVAFLIWQVGHIATAAATSFGGFIASRVMAWDPWLDNLRLTASFQSVKAQADARHAVAARAFLEAGGDEVLGPGLV